MAELETGYIWVFTQAQDCTAQRGHGQRGGTHPADIGGQDLGDELGTH